MRIRDGRIASCIVIWASKLAAFLKVEGRELRIIRAESMISQSGESIPVSSKFCRHGWNDFRETDRVDPSIEELQPRAPKRRGAKSMWKALVLAWLTGFAAMAPRAHASWQFTKWGMSPQQVIKASRGHARRMSEIDRAAYSSVQLEADVEMDYPQGNDGYRVIFSFLNNKLDKVTLLNVGDAVALLEPQYGKPDVKSYNTSRWN